MKEFIKKIIRHLPVAFTKNQQYDRETKAVIKSVCTSASNCIDVGCHKGEILQLMIKAAPDGQHFAFEPIPSLFFELQAKYKSPSVHLHNLALSNKEGTSSFNYVTSNPAYSGLLKRTYDRQNEKDISIMVHVSRLDKIIPRNLKIDFIKIDVEGGELQVLEGALEIIKKDRPFIVFEHGLGASEFYHSTPDKVYRLLRGCGLDIALLSDWLNNRNAFTLQQFEEQYFKKLNYYFLAYPQKASGTATKK